MRIVITTPTGHIGGRVVAQLFASDAELILPVRHPDKLSKDVRSRATVQQGSQDDADFFRQATEGADALFWLTPPDPTVRRLQDYYERMAESAVGAVEANSIRRVVHLSSVGAQLPGAGPITMLGMIEQRLNATNADVLHLRPGFFMENYFQQLESIKSHGGIHMPLPSDVPFPLIATRDIGDVAAHRLQDPSWIGKRILGLHGPADFTQAQAAGVFSEVLGRRIRYIQIAPAQARQALIGLGASGAFADAYVEMIGALGQAGAVAEPRTAETTTPTTLAQWASEALKPLV